MGIVSQSQDVDPWRNHVTTGLMVFAALGTLYVFLDGSPTLLEVGAAGLVDAQHSVGALLFAALYFLLGVRPRRYLGVWELLIAHRLTLAGLGLYWVIGGSPNAITTFAGNVVLAFVLIAAYVSGRGYTAWSG